MESGAESESESQLSAPPPKTLSRPGTQEIVVSTNNKKTVAIKSSSLTPASSLSHLKSKQQVPSKTVSSGTHRAKKVGSTTNSMSTEEESQPTSSHTHSIGQKKTERTDQSFQNLDSEMPDVNQKKPVSSEENTSPHSISALKHEVKASCSIKIPEQEVGKFSQPVIICDISELPQTGTEGKTNQKGVDIPSDSEENEFRSQPLESQEDSSSLLSQDAIDDTSNTAINPDCDSEGKESQTSDSDSDGPILYTDDDDDDDDSSERKGRGKKVCPCAEIEQAGRLDYLEKAGQGINTKSHEPLFRFRSKSDTSSFNRVRLLSMNVAGSVDGLDKATFTNCDTQNSGNQTPPLKRKGRLSSIGKIFKPWKWRKKKASEKFIETSAVLERKISMRQSREELIRRGVLREIPDQDSDVPDNVGESNGHTVPISEEPPREKSPAAENGTVALKSHSLEEKVEDPTERPNNCPEMLPTTAPSQLKQKKPNIPPKTVAATGSHKKVDSAAKHTVAVPNKQPPAVLPKPTNRTTYRSTEQNKTTGAAQLKAKKTATSSKSTTHSPSQKKDDPPQRKTTKGITKHTSVHHNWCPTLGAKNVKDRSMS
ncbi:phosphatase and actin regulator 2-like [Xenopus laevis]|uniref:Phosphatase and actin regulator n=1 Tax=Xenopus laevis TaxID=8355 RepID=A0A8J1MG06_XENLA|nr:phosphatase and actin regulator 2-like [Xenopus laevis]